MTGLPFDLDDTDDIGFIHQVKPIVAGVLGVVAPAEIYVVKIDSWFGERWLGFSHKLLGKVGVNFWRTLRVPPFVPARVVSQRYFRVSQNGEYGEAESTSSLHIKQSTEDNARRLMSLVCPTAAVIWWSGETRRNQRGCLMAYLPTQDGHACWYAEFKKVDNWRLVNTRRTTAQELSTYAAGAPEDLATVG